MLCMLIGVVFALVALRVPIGGMELDILPDVVGYALIAVGMDQMKEITLYRRARLFAWGAAAVSVLVLWVGTLDVKVQLYMLCSLAGLCLGAYVTWQLALGLIELEQMVGVPLNGDKMKIPWMIYLAAELYTYWSVVAVLPDLQSITVFVAPAAAIFYAILLYSGWRGYVDHGRRSSGQ